MNSKKIIVLLLFGFFYSTLNSACARTYKIYLDADRSYHFESARAIEMGVKTAFAEINNEINDINFEFVIKDHRGNSKRSKLHMQQFKDDPAALFIMAGLHSPPLIKYRDFINENQILTLVPWAAGGPITRYPRGLNFVFRLSIDDTKAGIRIASYAIDKLGSKKPYLLLENTPWGKSNYKTMRKVIMDKIGIDPKVEWFNWNLKEKNAKILIRDISVSGADSVLLVSNAIEGGLLIKLLASSYNSIPVISHWGITGGDFHKRIPHDKRDKVNLKFIQSCFSFISSHETEFTKTVFTKAQRQFPELVNYESLPAPTGFIHAYDFSKIVIQAMSEIEFTGNIKDDRRLLRDKLENLNTKVQGLIKTYKTPFSKYSSDNPDAHEALGLDDICIGSFSKANTILVEDND